MIKAKIKKIELRLLKNGVFKCGDPQLLARVKMLSEDFDRNDNGYYPDRKLGKMIWICEQLGGSVIHADQIDYSKFSDDVVFGMK